MSALDVFDSMLWSEKKWEAKDPLAWVIFSTRDQIVPTFNAPRAVELFRLHANRLATHCAAQGKELVTVAPSIDWKKIQNSNIPTCYGVFTFLETNFLHLRGIFKGILAQNSYMKETFWDNPSACRKISNLFEFKPEIRKNAAQKYILQRTKRVRKFSDKKYTESSFTNEFTPEIITSTLWETNEEFFTLFWKVIEALGVLDASPEISPHIKAKVAVLSHFLSTLQITNQLNTLQDYADCYVEVERLTTHQFFIEIFGNEFAQDFLYAYSFLYYRYYQVVVTVYTRKEQFNLMIDPTSNIDTLFVPNDSYLTPDGRNALVNRILNDPEFKKEFWRLNTEQRSKALTFLPINGFSSMIADPKLCLFESNIVVDIETPDGLRLFWFIGTLYNMIKDSPTNSDRNIHEVLMTSCERLSFAMDEQFDYYTDMINRLTRSLNTTTSAMFLEVDTPDSLDTLVKISNLPSSLEVLFSMEPQNRQKLVSLFQLPSFLSLSPEALSITSIHLWSVSAAELPDVIDCILKLHRKHPNYSLDFLLAAGELGITDDLFLNQDKLNQLAILKQAGLTTAFLRRVYIKRQVWIAAMMNTPRFEQYFIGQILEVQSSANSPQEEDKRIDAIITEHVFLDKALLVERYLPDTHPFKIRYAAIFPDWITPENIDLLGWIIHEYTWTPIEDFVNRAERLLKNKEDIVRIWFLRLYELVYPRILQIHQRAGRSNDLFFAFAEQLLNNPSPRIVTVLPLFVNLISVLKWEWFPQAELIKVETALYRNGNESIIREGLSRDFFSGLSIGKFLLLESNHFSLRHQLSQKYDSVTVEFILELPQTLHSAFISLASYEDLSPTSQNQSIFGIIEALTDGTLDSALFLELIELLKISKHYGLGISINDLFPLLTSSLKPDRLHQLIVDVEDPTISFLEIKTHYRRFLQDASFKFSKTEINSDSLTMSNFSGKIYFCWIVSDGRKQLKTHFPWISPENVIDIPSYLQREMKLSINIQTIIDSMIPHSIILLDASQCGKMEKEYLLRTARTYWCVCLKVPGISSWIARMKEYFAGTLQ